MADVEVKVLKEDFKPEARFSFGMCYGNDTVWVYGGAGDDGDVNNELWSLNCMYSIVYVCLC